MPPVLQKMRNMNKDQRGKYVRQKANLRVGWKEQTDVVNNITLVFLAIKS